MPNVPDEIVKTVVIEGVKSAVLGKAITIAGKGVTVALGNTVKNNAALGGLAGSLGGLAATSLLQQASLHLPGLTAKILDAMGRGGFQRGELASAEALLELIKGAGTIEMLNYLMGLINLNPNTRLLKNAITVSGSVGVTYLGIQQILKFQGARQSTMLITKSLEKQITLKLTRLREAGKIPDSYINILELEMASDYNERALRAMLDRIERF